MVSEEALRNRSILNYVKHEKQYIPNLRFV